MHGRLDYAFSLHSFSPSICLSWWNQFLVFSASNFVVQCTYLCYRSSVQYICFPLLQPRTPYSAIRRISLFSSATGCPLIYALLPAVPCSSTLLRLMNAHLRHARTNKIAARKRKIKYSSKINCFGNSEKKSCSEDNSWQSSWVLWRRGSTSRLRPCRTLFREHHFHTL